VRAAFLTAAFGLACSLAASGEGARVKFSAKPAATKTGDKVKISFTTSAPTDVEVSILDAKGKVVRHLAAGVLGGKTPPPKSLKAGLSQNLEWDGKNDLGEKATGGPFKIRVRLGLRAELDDFLAEDREWIGQLTGLATDPKGRLYVYSSLVTVHRGYSRCLQVFSRDGKYVKTIMPMPADRPKEKLTGFNVTYRRKARIVLDVPGEHFYPRNHFGTWPEFYPGRMGELIPFVREDGILTIVNNGTSIGRLTVDGECAEKDFWRGLHSGALPKWRSIRGAKSALPSPDGKFMYLSGFAAIDSKTKKHSEKWPRGRIYRMSLESGKKLEKWIDLADGEKPAIAGAAGFDHEGNFMCYNGGTGKIHALDKTGKELGKFDALTELLGKPTGPRRIFCHRKTGEIYVSYIRQKGPRNRDAYIVHRKIIKYAPWKKGGKKIWEHKPPNSPRAYHVGGIEHTALDDSADPAILWIGGTSKAVRGRSYIYRMEDKGDKLVETGDLIDLCRSGLIVKSRMAVHPETDTVMFNDGYNNVGAINGLTGEKVKLPFKGGVDMGVGLDGKWYVQTGMGYSGPIRRFDKDLKPIPVPGRTAGKKQPATNTMCSVYGRMGAGYCTVGLTADGRGRLYTMQFYTWAKYAVGIIGPDGKPEDPGRLKDDPAMKKCPRFKSAVVAPIGRSPGGVQVDFQNNVYVGVKILPADYKAPKGFEHARTGYNAMTGTIIKFGPEGGMISGSTKGKIPDGATSVDHRWGFMSPVNYKGYVSGVLKMYPGLGCVSGGFGDGCMCRQPMFQVDGWGRIFYTSAATCSVKIVDNQGNLIQEFGHYGNIDSRGPGEKSLVKKPAIPFGWPQAVGVSNTKIYVADAVNRRIVRLKKVYAAAETCAVK
jgi:hypothetical protein